MGLGHDTITWFTGQCGESFIPQLISQVRGEARGRAAAAFVLGEVRARGAIADLAAVLAQESQDLRLEVACIEALAKIGDPSAAPALTKAARHQLAWVRPPP